MGVATAPFTKGLGVAQDGLSKLSGGITSTQGILASFGAAIGAGAAVAGLVALTKSSMDTIATTAKLADQIGTSTESLVGLQHAAKLTGTDTEMLGEQLTKLPNILATAATSGGPAADALKRLGLDAGKLANGDVIEGFTAISDKLSEIKNPAERAQASVAIFGEEGLKMGSLLSQGSEGIAKARAEAEKLGLTFSRTDASKVIEANKAWGKVGDVLTGVGNTIAVAVAPYVEALTNKFLEFAGNGQKVGSIVTTALEWIGSAVGVVADVVQALGIGWKALQATATVAIASILSALAKFAKGIQEVYNLIPGVNLTFGDTITSIADGVSSLANDQLSDLNKALVMDPPSAGINGFFADIRNAAEKTTDAVGKTSTQMGAFGGVAVKLSGDISTLESKLKEQIATFGMTGNQIEIYKLAQAGASQEQLASVSAMSAQIAKMQEDKKAQEDLAASAKAAKQKEADDAKKAQEDLASSAKSLIEETKSPFEKFGDKLKEISKLQESGLITDAQASKAATLAQDAITPKDSGPKTAAALDAKSTEARSLILANAGQGGGSDPINDVAKSSKDTYSETVKTNALLAKILGKASGADLLTI